MQTRRFGRTGHMSTVAIFGAAALWKATQAEADAVVEQVIAAGVNHFDVAPSYGLAEERLGPWMPRLRDQIFLGCKTMERDAAGAAAELRRSLDLLQVDSFDLYQIHAVETMADLDAATRSGGALDAIVKARRGADQAHWNHRPRRPVAGRISRGTAPLRLRLGAVPHQLRAVCQP
ncbi:MAG: aldo/keto reductase [Caldilineales bacterium]